MSRLDPKRQKDEDLSKAKISQTGIRENLTKDVDMLVMFSNKFAYVETRNDYYCLKGDTKRSIIRLFERNRDWMDAVYEGAVKKILSAGKVEVLKGLGEVLKISGENVDIESIFSKREIVESLKKTVISVLPEDAGIYRALVALSYLPQGEFITAKKDITALESVIVSKLSSYNACIGIGSILSLQSCLREEDRERGFCSKAAISAFQKGLVKLFIHLDDDNYQKAVASYFKNKDKMPEQLKATFKSKEVTDGLKAAIIHYLSKKQGIANCLRNNLKLLMTGIVADPKEVIGSDEVKQAWLEAIVAQILNNKKVGCCPGVQSYSLLTMTKVLGQYSSLITDSPEINSILKSVITDLLSSGGFEHTTVISRVLFEIWGKEKGQDFIRSEIQDSAWAKAVNVRLSNPKARISEVMRCINSLKLNLGVDRAYDIITSSEVADSLKACLCSDLLLREPIKFKKKMQELKQILGVDLFQRFLSTDTTKEVLLFAAKQLLSDRSPVTIVSLLDNIANDINRNEFVKLFASDEEYFSALSSYMKTKLYPRPRLIEFYEELSRSRH